MGPRGDDELGWEPQRHHRSHPDFALELELRAERFHQALGQGKAEAGALVLSRIPQANLAVRGEGDGNILRGDADAGVADDAESGALADRKRVVWGKGVSVR